MKSIREIVPKPSDALQAMVNGLHKQNLRSDFQIEMSTFGTYDPDDKICFGCAATCTIQEIGGFNLPLDFITGSTRRAMVYDFNQEDLNRFENAIDDARSGNLHYLFKYYDINVQDVGRPLLVRPIYLSTEEWKEQLPEFEDWIKELQDAGY